MARPKKVVTEELELEIEQVKEVGVATDLLYRPPVTPDYGSEEWSDYVLGQFKEDELVDGHPNIDGLRRVAENLLGSFIESGPVEVKSSLDGDTTGRAYCVYQIVVYPFMLGYNQPAVSDGFEKRVYRASADSYKGNTDDKFAIYPLAMAETRAEGRCLRKMLKLRGPAAEELTSKNASDTIAKEESLQIAKGFDENGQIATSQIFVIRRKCADLKIDMMKLINSGTKQYTNIEELTHETGKAVVQRLTQYQTGSVEIPAEFIIGV